ncbi:MAG: Crp/Fnr family transcriptional regulator [Deltaproteobacteria bacterium]|nr:Crp/Fnr family transcriptional regulator [Deltaproteobacteria bacterium]
METMTASLLRNRLLAHASPDDFRLLEPHLEPITLPIRFDLERRNTRIEHVYFMNDGIASVVGVQGNETRIEVGLVGCEGMTGTAVVLGDDRSPHSTYMQVSGDGQRIASAALRSAMKASGSLSALLLKYVHAFHLQTAHTAIANASARIDERCARWILMAHDRVRGDRLALTHESLALMLGVRRAGVTEALHSLSREGHIALSRGEITVLDRNGLEGAAKDSYGAPEAEFRRLFGYDVGVLPNDKRMQEDASPLALA